MLRHNIEELNAKFDHIQERFDNLRDKNYEVIDKYNTADYYWNRFEDILAWSLKFDQNSEEYNKLSKVAWDMLDKYLSILLTTPFKGNK